MRSGIKGVLKRGKVDVFVTVQDLAPAAPDIQIDDAALGAVKTALEGAKSRFLMQSRRFRSRSWPLTKDWFVQTPPAIDTDPAGRL